MFPWPKTFIAALIQVSTFRKSLFTFLKSSLFTICAISLIWFHSIYLFIIFSFTFPYISCILLFLCFILFKSIYKISHFNKPVYINVEHLTMRLDVSVTNYLILSLQWFTIQTLNHFLRWKCWIALWHKCCCFSQRSILTNALFIFFYCSKAYLKLVFVQVGYSRPPFVKFN